MTAREKFDMETIGMRVNDLCAEYNNTLRQKVHLHASVKTNMKTGYILIRFDTFAYLIFGFDNKYIFSWFRLSGDKAICDGFTICSDVSTVVREVNDRLFSCFSPNRGNRWYMLNKRILMSKKRG